jgi:hypothetical protein
MIVLWPNITLSHSKDRFRSAHTYGKTSNSWNLHKGRVDGGLKEARLLGPLPACLIRAAQFVLRAVVHGYPELTPKTRDADILEAPTR